MPAARLYDCGLYTRLRLEHHGAVPPPGLGGGYFVRSSTARSTFLPAFSAGPARAGLSFPSSTPPPFSAPPPISAPFSRVLRGVEQPTEVTSTAALRTPIMP